MPLTYIEQGITGDVTCDDEYGVGILQTRINLPKQKKFTVESIDVFDDNGSVGINFDDPNIKNAVVYYVSPYPIQLTNMGWGNSGAETQRQGPLAGDGQILFKKIGIREFEPNGNLWVWTQYPTAQIAADVGKSWYSPHVYVTALYYSAPGATYNFNYTVTIGVKTVKASSLMSSKMNFREFRDAQCRLLSNVAVNIPLNQWTGQTYPMWTYGGVRPELVMSSTDILTYWSDSELLNPERAQSRAGLEAQFIASQTTVAFDQAFGSQPLDLPVWLNITASGISTGAIRKQWPPNKYADNGNTLTF
jgi:hypothetical protein